MPGSTGGGWKRSDPATVTGVAQPTGKPAEDRPQALPSGTATAPALDPTILAAEDGASLDTVPLENRIQLLTCGSSGHQAPEWAAVRWPPPIRVRSPFCVACTAPKLDLEIVTCGLAR